ncbi:hypothetical protein WR25_10970 [Diploscapter pachys]|uniref:Diacylglycerol kinase n=1 Tax=Diploscapter pachys TaxID=2018661 RepID=A0A2A2LY38_9BILA|nr:hypothetical protein WR25_10970 [Diploscapter pachys]
MNLWKDSLAAVRKQLPEKASAIDYIADITSGQHQWSPANHARPTFCNFCREKLSGVPWHGYSCDVCKLKAHKKCMSKIKDVCKWSVESSIPPRLQYNNPENTILSHQWVEGNLPMSSKCAVCEKVCGSVLKLSDWRCLWCACFVHDGCLSSLSRGCTLGPASLSVLSPVAIRSVTLSGSTEIRTDAIGGECPGGSPLLVFVNSKSGNSQGQRMIRKLRRLLNPLQVFDITACPPEFTLTFFEALETFRVLVCGGDGTVGWVLSAIDKLGLHSRCQLAVLPLGTGNDLARVLGWGHAFYDENQLPQLVRVLERAHTRMLDRWSIFALEGDEARVIQQHEAILIDILTDIFKAHKTKDVHDSVAQLCSAINAVDDSSSDENQNRPSGTNTAKTLCPCDDHFANCSETLLGKLRVLLRTFDATNKQKDQKIEQRENGNVANGFVAESEWTARAESFKKTLHEIMTISVKRIHSQNNFTGIAATKRERFGKKRSRTTPGPGTSKFSHSTVSSFSASSPPPSPFRLHVGPNVSQTVSSCELSAALSSSNALPPIEILEPLTLNASSKQDSSNMLEVSNGTEDTSSFDETEGGMVKRQSECALHTATNEEVTNVDIKLSHSDSSLYERTQTALNGRKKPHHERHKSDAPYTTKNSVPTRNLAGASMIAEVLLLNLPQLKEPSLDKEFRAPIREYKELKVMNNYFGIGLDAKIALEFHNKREESDKTRSRSKLFLWYGMLGGKELVHRTYRNLEQRIKLECDGVPIDLPSLQGIVILNIPSYSGGANFWGTAKDDSFTVQSFDDRVLEVVALFGVIHVATSRVPNVVRLQNHRIAQCRHVRILILGGESIPIQVDGEPWLQPPGILQISHKNRAQLLVKNSAFDATLRKWEEQKERSTAPSTPTHEMVSFVKRACEFVRLVETEMTRLGVSNAMLEALDAASNAISAQQEAEQSAKDVTEEREEVLATVERLLDLLEDHFGWSTARLEKGQAPHFAFELASSTSQQTCSGEESDHWRFTLNSMRLEMRREEASLIEMRGGEIRGRKKGRLIKWIGRRLRRKHQRAHSDVSDWSVDDVCKWLSSLGLSHYTQQFKSNEIRGSELIHLAQSDLRELGVQKMGHLKRFETAISALREKSTAETTRSRRKGNSLSEERRQQIEAASAELPSINSL